MSGRASAARLMVSPATGVRLARKVRAGEDIAPATCGRRPGGGKLGPVRATLEEMVAADRDITMVELSRALADATGVRADEASIGRALRRWGLRVKKSR
jgi:transposase